MADADFTSILIHTCTIQRKTATGTDAHGHETFTWDNLATLVPCRLETLPQREVQIVSDQRVVIEDLNIMLEPGVDITEDDRITTVVRTADSAALEGTFSVLLVVDSEDDSTTLHHREAKLDRIKDP